MLTTPIYGFRYPDLADVADANLDFKNLALDVEGILSSPPYVGQTGYWIGQDANTIYTNHFVFASRPTAAAALGVHLGSEGSWRWYVTSDGVQNWSDGTAAADTTLYRQSAGVLKTGGRIDAAGGFYVNGTPVGGGGGTPDGVGYDTITATGTPLPKHGVINFLGPGVTVADDSGNGRTNVTIPGGGSGTGPKIASGSTVVALNSSGYGTIYYGTTFTTIATVVAVNGEIDMENNDMVVLDPISLDHFDLRCNQGSLFSSNVKVNWIAVGT